MNSAVISSPWPLPYAEALGPGNVLGIGAHAITLPYTYGPNSATAPALRLGAWQFTGGASG